MISFFGYVSLKMNSIGKLILQIKLLVSFISFQQFISNLLTRNRRNNKRIYIRCFVFVYQCFRNGKSVLLNDVLQ